MCTKLSKYVTDKALQNYKKKSSIKYVIDLAKNEEYPAQLV